jgi:hypothetical protein
MLYKVKDNPIKLSTCALSIHLLLIKQEVSRLVL